MKHYYLEMKIFTVSQLNMEDITDADYRNAKMVFKDFEVNNLGEYHNLYAQSDRLVLANVFE